MCCRVAGREGELQAIRSMQVESVPAPGCCSPPTIFPSPYPPTPAAPLLLPQALAYYGGMLAYYWLLATPVVGLVFGVYLYASTCLFGVHYDEAFSSLRVADHKALTRMHVTRWEMHVTRWRVHVTTRTLGPDFPLAHAPTPSTPPPSQRGKPGDLHSGGGQGTEQMAGGPAVARQEWWRQCRRRGAQCGAPQQVGWEGGRAGVVVAMQTSQCTMRRNRPAGVSLWGPLGAGVGAAMQTMSRRTAVGGCARWRVLGAPCGPHPSCSSGSPLVLLDAGGCLLGVHPEIATGLPLLPWS